MKIRSIAAGLLMLGLLVTSGDAEAKKPKPKPIRRAENLGLGIGTSGTALGVSGKWFYTPNISVQGTVGMWQTRQFEGFRLAATGDALIELPFFYRSPTLNIAPVLGAGGWLAMATDVTHIGATGVGGLSFLLRKVPAELSVEYRPTYGIINVEGFDWVNFGVHAHFFFR